VEQIVLISREISALIDTWDPVLRGLSPESISLNRNSQNRSIRQIVGHMHDSASNNTHRIVHLQYQESPVAFPDYANLGNNDRWIAIQNYQEKNWENLVSLWSTTHRHFAHVILHADSGKMENFWISALGEKVSLLEMITDFPNHFRLHIAEIEALINSN
jgi:hypothetical protein